MICAAGKFGENLLSRIPRKGQEVAIGLVLLVTLVPIVMKFYAPTPVVKPIPTAGKMAESVLLYAFLAFVAITIAVSFLSSTSREYFGFEGRSIKKLFRSGLLWGGGAFLAVQALAFLVGTIAKAFGLVMPLQETFTCLFSGGSPVGYRVLLILSVVVVVPIYEEMLFRGLLFPGLLALFSEPEKIGVSCGQRLSEKQMSRSSLIWAFVLSGLFFAVIHRHFLLLPQLFLLHLFLTWVYWSTGSLLPSMIMHALFNGTNLLLFTLFYTSAS